MLYHDSCMALRRRIDGYSKRFAQRLVQGWWCERRGFLGEQVNTVGFRWVESPGIGTTIAGVFRNAPSSEAEFSASFTLSLSTPRRRYCSVPGVVWGRIKGSRQVLVQRPSPRCRRGGGKAPLARMAASSVSHNPPCLVEKCEGV
jgi:hypothetical protein